tara:strand:+ start:327 stop:887 length:561 start_codon:yes stop_codon:yes gene_type:complete
MPIQRVKPRFSDVKNVSIAASTLPAGSIIQTQKTVVTSTNTTTMTSNTVVEVTGLSVNITPQFSNSIIYLTGQVVGEPSANGPHNMTFMFRRGSTDLKGPVASNRNVGIMFPSLSYYSTDQASTPDSAVYFFHDTPSSTSELTYKIAVQTSVAGDPVWHLNKTVSDTDNSAYERGVSFIMAQEIKV